MSEQIDNISYIISAGHLDRVEQGVEAKGILGACDERLTVTENLTNPTISLAQAFRRHNLATFRHMAHQRIEQVGSVEILKVKQYLSLLA